jgi:hypothetical protein
VDTAVQEASGGGKNVNDLIRQAAQIISKQASGVPLQNIESIIIQMALQTSKAQGKAIAGQTIFEVANQIVRNPNGVLTQAIIQLAKQDTHDGGKTGQTVNVIKNVVKETDTVLNRVSQRSGEVDSPGQGGKPPGSTSNVQAPGSTSNVQAPESATQTTQIKPPSSTTTATESKPNLLNTVIISLGRGVIDLAFGKGTSEFIDGVEQIIRTAHPHISNVAAQITALEFALQEKNKGVSQGSQTLNNLQAIVTNPNSLTKMGDIAELRQIGNDVSASQASNIVTDKTAAGVDPAVAIQGTSISAPANTGTGASTPSVAGTEAPAASPDGAVPPEGGAVEAAAAAIEPTAPVDTQAVAASAGAAAGAAASGSPAAVSAADTTTSAGTPSGEDVDTEGDGEEESETSDEDEDEASNDDEAEEESGGEDEGGDGGDGNDNDDGGDGGGDGGDGGDGGG